jgi:hypothetical protein
MNRLNTWRLCDELTVVQAAFLIIGENPNDYPNILDWRKSDNTFSPPTVVDSAPPDPYDTPPDRTDFSSLPDLPSSEPTPDPPAAPSPDLLRNFGAIFTALTNAINGDRLKAKTYSTYEEPWELAPGQEPFDCYKSTIVVEDLREWLRCRGVTEGFFFPDTKPGPDYLNSDHPNYAPKLAAAIKAWEAVTHEPEYIKKPWHPKKKLVHWLENNAAKLGLIKNDGETDRWVIENLIAKVANWKPQGGAPKTAGNK